MDLMQFVSAMDEKLAACYKETNLKRLRQYAGLSQSELAELSKVPLRQIQLFEQRQRNINHTTAVTVPCRASVPCTTTFVSTINPPKQE